MENYISRIEALNVLYRLAGSSIINNDISDAIEEIALCIEEERYGRHIWGANPREIAELHTAWREDLLDDAKIKRWNEINDKLTFEPSKSEVDMLDGGRFDDDIDECDPFD